MNYRETDDLYMGEWSEDERHGVGVIKFADGSTFTGSFKEGERDEGVLKLANGDEYAGSFKQDLFEGYSLMKY